MVTEWGATVLTAGAVASAAAGVWTVWQIAPRAHRIRRRVGHERVRLPVSKERASQLSTAMPAMAGAVGLYVLVSALTGGAVLAFLTALGGFMLPRWVKEYRETRRLIQLSDQLGRAMGMIATSLRRGVPLEAAIAETASTMPEPLGPILKHLADATALGVTLSQASEQVRQQPEVRLSTDFQVFATEMVICHERGANVVQAFEALRHVLDARRRYRDQVKEHMGQHLMQSLVIAGIGLFVLVAYSLMADEGLRPLLGAPIGQIILAVSILGNVGLIRWTHLSMLGQLKRV